MEHLLVIYRIFKHIVMEFVVFSPCPAASTGAQVPHCKNAVKAARGCCYKKRKRKNRSLEPPGSGGAGNSAARQYVQRSGRSQERRRDSDVRQKGIKWQGFTSKAKEACAGREEEMGTGPD